MNHLIRWLPFLIGLFGILWRPQDLPLWAGGLAFGLISQRSRLCLSAAVRDPVLFGITQMSRAILVMLLVGGLGGVAARAAHSAAGLDAPGFEFSVGLSTVTGGLLFGAGMVLAGSCAAGAFWRLGEGQTGQLWTLLGALAGSLAGISTRGWWGRWPHTPTPIVLDRLFSGPVVAASYALVLGGLWALILYWERRQPALGEEELAEPARGLRHWLRTPWPAVLGAVLAGAAWAAGLWLSGRPWRLTRAFLGDGDAMVFALGLIAGGWLGAHLGQEFRWRPMGIPASGPRRAPLLRQLTWRLIGGFLMGVGARLGFGCSIGALLGGIGATSLHGWVWALAAVVGGSLAGLWLKKRLHHVNIIT